MSRMSAWTAEELTTMSNPTQGTWTFENDVCHATGQPCFHIGTKECGHTIGLAYEKDDAALIAAAPELLDSCLELVGALTYIMEDGYEFDGGKELIRNAFNAIARSTGVDPRDIANKINKEWSFTSPKVALDCLEDFFGS